MAAAEARAAWQRTANRCFVQEDAKRAPKLACTQSSTPWSKQADVEPTSTIDGSNSPALGFMPFSQNHSHTNLPPEARWWLQLDPNHDHPKGFGYEFKPLPENMKPSDNVTRITPEKHEKEEKIKEPSAMNCKVDPDVIDFKELTDYYELLEMELVEGSVSKQCSELSCDMDSTWIEAERVPWWRKTDKDDLAMFVAEKSLDHIENCDLPPLKNMQGIRDLCKKSTCFDDDEMLASFEEWSQTNSTSNLHSRLTPEVGSKRSSDWASADRGLSEIGSLSMDRNNTLNNKHRHSSEETSRAELLEALCHSQTRAREAEKAAKAAYTEKEHILKLFFKQASQLFAYKQWFRLLQLETLHLQLNSSNHPPDNNPFTPKPHRIWRESARDKRRKRGPPGCDVCKYAVAFALGLSLVGTGLLLGWTVGWLFAAF